MPVSARSMATQIADTGNTATYVSGTFTPSPGKLYLLAACHSDAAAEATIPTIATTSGLTFVQIGTSVVFDTIASNIHRLTVFRAMKASGLSAGTYTVTMGDAATGCAAMLIELNEVVQTGVDGANAVIQSPSSSANAGANPNVTLAAFGSTANATLLFVASDIQTAPTADTSWTEVGTNPDYATPATGLACFFRNDNDTTATCTLTASDWGALAVEIAYAHNVEALRGWEPRYPAFVPAKTEVVASGQM